MLKVRKGDTVAVLKGKDKGKRGRVMRVFAQENKALVEGVNYVKKAKRRTSQEQQHAGIVQMEKPVAVANIAVVCKNCDTAVKVGFSILKDGTKTRICKKCSEAIQ